MMKFLLMMKPVNMKVCFVGHIRSHHPSISGFAFLSHAYPCTTFTEGDARGKQTRSEKKSRKAMQKLGMKPVPGIVRVQIKKNKNVRPWKPTTPVHAFLHTHEIEGVTMLFRLIPMQIMFVINTPDVYKSPASDTYVIFGEAKIEDLGAQANASLAEQFRVQEPPSGVSAVGAGKADEAEADENDEDVDESDVDSKDIELVMTQAGVSRGKAVKALKAAEGDIVSAIMELTM